MLEIAASKWVVDQEDRESECKGKEEVEEAEEEEEEYQFLMKLEPSLWAMSLSMA